MFIAAVSTLFMMARLRTNANELALVDKQKRELREDVSRFRGEGEKVQRELTPDQRALLSAAHKLVANKNFGWSRLFADLEGVMPGGVSASRIEVQNVFRDGDRVKADLEFAVLSSDYRAVMSMIGSMNSSGLFQAELREQSLRQTDRQTYTEYTLRLIYSPPYGIVPTANNETASISGEGQAQ